MIKNQRTGKIQSMKDRVYVRPRFRKLNNNEYMTFWYSLRDARAINNHGEFVLLRDVEVYQESQCFLIGHGIAGFAIHNDEMISVHKNNKKAQETAVCHILPKMVRCAFKYGAKFGDCYGDFLANYYMSSGFIVVAKINFDDLEDNPKKWNYEKFGKPNCYLMMRGVKNVAELDRLKEQGVIVGFDAIKDSIPAFKSYEEAEKYREELYNKIKIYGYKKRLEIVKNS